MPTVRTHQTNIVSQRNPIRAGNSDAEYMQMIEKYKGNPYYQQMVDNPWLLSNNAEFSPTLWQGLAENLFGVTSAKDAYYADLLAKRNEHFANIQALANEYELNKPTNQVALERAAGLNPDLVGLSAAQPAPGNDQPIQGNQMNPSGQDVGMEIQQFGQIGMSFITSLFNLGKSIQGFQSNAFAIAGQEIQNNKDATDFVIESIAKSAPFKDVNEISDASVEQLSDYVLDAASKVDYSGYSPYTRKLMKRMFRQYDTLLRSGKDTLGVAAFKAELRDKFATHHYSASKTTSQFGFSESFNDFVKFFAENFADAEYKLSQKSLKVAGAELSAREAGAKEAESEHRYNKNYFDYANSQKLHRASIDSEKEGYQAQKAANEAQKVINETWDKTIQYLKGGDEWYNSLGVLLAAYFRAMSMHPPVISVSGPKTTNHMETYDSHDYNQKKSVNRFANQL